MTDDTDLDTLEDPHYWRESVIPDDLIQRVRSIMPDRDSWSDEALMFGDEQGSDFEVWYSEKDVDSIYFRWDLRSPDLEVLNQIVTLARRLGAYIVSGDRATVVEPDFQAVLSDIRHSSAYRFCQDPQAFLTELGRNTNGDNSKDSF